MVGPLSHKILLVTATHRCHPTAATKIMLAAVLILSLPPNVGWFVILYITIVG